ncbi:hypothetical protein [Metarhizobium album]|uniref:hypothetical protein n=1 Tax=Metarhizobium album TaxID=2182425 RepID=UPI000FFEF0F7|nr:hypothetical protein [Rhizobium album]
MSTMPKSVTSTTLKIFVTAALLAAVPYGLTISKETIAFGEPVLLAKNGNGNGGGKGGGNGNNGGNGNGNGSNNAGGRGSQIGKGQTKSKSADMTVNHPNGIAESIINDRYIMTDAKGRTIINRMSRPADFSRLRALSR